MVQFMHIINKKNLTIPKIDHQHLFAPQNPVSNCPSGSQQICGIHLLH